MVREANTIYYGTVQLNAPSGLKRQPQHRHDERQNPGLKNFVAEAILLGRREANLGIEPDLNGYGSAVALLLDAGLTQGQAASLVRDYGLPHGITWDQVLCLAYSTVNSRY